MSKKQVKEFMRENFNLNTEMDETPPKDYSEIENDLERIKCIACDKLDIGDHPISVWAIFKHDMSKHEHLKNHIGIDLGTMTIPMLENNIHTRLNLKQFIEGFN